MIVLLLLLNYINILFYSRRETKQNLLEVLEILTEIVRLQNHHKTKKLVAATPLPHVCPVPTCQAKMPNLTWYFVHMGMHGLDLVIYMKTAYQAGMVLMGAVVAAVRYLLGPNSKK